MSGTVLASFSCVREGLKNANAGFQQLGGEGGGYPPNLYCKKLRSDAGKDFCRKTQPTQITKAALGVEEGGWVVLMGGRTQAKCWDLPPFSSNLTNVRGNGFCFRSHGFDNTLKVLLGIQPICRGMIQIRCV